MKKITLLNAKFLAVIACLVVASVSAQGLPRSLTNRGLRNATGGTPVAPGMGRATGGTSVAAETSSKGKSSDLNFNQTPIDLVFETYSRMVGKTILKDPQVPNANITLKSESGQKLTEEEQIEAIEIVLEMNGVHLEPYGESFIRALPRKDARKEGIPLIMDAETKLRESGRVVSMMIPFKNISTDEAQKALEGLKSASGILLVFERTNSILVTDTEQNINRMLEIAKMIDVASPVTEVVEYIQIKYANANEVKTVIDNIVQESQKEQEKNGKGAQNAAQQPRPSPFAGRLLGRNNQQQQQQTAPVNNASLVMSVSDADRGMIRGKVVTIADERSNKILIITSATNMKFFKEVIAALDVETTPDTVVKVYRLKYAEAEDVSDMINDLIGNSVSGKNSGKSNQNQNAAKGTSGSVTRGNQQVSRQPANQRSGEAKAGELNKDNTTVLADKRINGIVVMTNKELVPTIESIIESMDVKLSQVLIETCIIEVTLGDDLKTGVDWLRTGRQKAQKQASDALGNLYYTKKTVTTEDGDSETTILTGPESWVHSDYKKTVLGENEETVFEAWTGDGVAFPMVNSLVKGNMINGDEGYASMLGGGGGGNSTMLNNLMDGSSFMGSATPIGGGINYFLRSDKLNLAAVIEASKTDSRTKYLASPIVMTVDNKEATINATRMKYLLKGFTSSGNSYSTIAVPDYEQKELGIEIKVTPKINPNGTVMLTVEEKYSQLGVEQEIKYATGNSGTSTAVEGVTGTSRSALESVMVPTTVTREMSADVLLENMQTVVFGGLTETTETDSENGIPILKDIPLIGKWLFGSVTKSESRNELLVFMTPYVLDEGAEAQAEALRRKKTMSDSRPWEDNGWSLSELADPVSKKEQMRRIKEEWKKQDEERKTKIAIEKMKVDRAKQLKELSKDERDLWLKMHKEELEEEQQEELEKKMLDKDSQEELKKLAEQIREKKLEDANKEIKKMEEMTAVENERGKLDAEKRAKVEEAKKVVPEKEVKPEPAKPNDKSILGRLSEEAK